MSPAEVLKSGRMGDDQRCYVEVLGPIRLSDAQGRDVTPVGALQRRLLALLVLRRGRVVSVDAAIDALWPVRPPRDPVAALHNHVFRLRRDLPDGLIESTADGYWLDPSKIELDADRLVALLNAGDAAGSADRATIDAILQRGPGAAYPELADVDDGRAEAMRLAELRFRALELRAEWRLGAGETEGLVAELAALAEAEPLRERPRALLMAALAATGRQVEALRVFDDFRRLLGDELGIEPSPALVAQHADLLAGTGTAGAGPGAWAPTSRLPAPATSLVGRDALVVEVTAMVEAHRLVTLVGPGGVGKTRLVVEVGHRLRAARPDRPVVLCELAAAVESSAIDVVAAALDIDARPGVEPVERLASVLGDSEIVMLLDNCEHVLDPVAELAEHVLARCPNVTLVTTSRERLRLPGEQVCAVPPLLTGASDAPAVRLFVERARAVAPSFEPEGDDLARVAEIVRRLDGLPLSIELAAARLHTHDVSEVAAGLDQRFALLSAGYRKSSRHGSLRAAVSWSFELLDEHLRRTFADLSVFVGSFTAADAAAICGVEPEAITADLAQLTERSLVVRAPDRRYVLLETLRAFGTEQLAATGRAELVSERHARHQVDWAERAGRLLGEPGQSGLAAIDDAIPELRAALGWLLDQQEVALAGRLAAALLDYGLMRLRPDVLAWSERVIAAEPDATGLLAARLWVASAYAAWMAGDQAATSARSERARQLNEQTGEAILPVVATMRGNVELFEGRLDEAMRWYRRGADATVGDPAQRAIVANTQLLALAYAADPSGVDLAADLLAEFGATCTPYAAYAWYCAGEAILPFDVDQARARYVRALELAEATHTSFVTGVAGAAKASIEARFGAPAVAAADYRSLIPHWRRAGMWSTQWTMLRSIAGLLARLGRDRDAAVLEGAVRSTDAGHRIFGADEVALTELGAQLRTALGDKEYQAALDEGAALDGDAAVERALRALSAPVD